MIILLTATLLMGFILGNLIEQERKLKLQKASLNYIKALEEEISAKDEVIKLQEEYYIYYRRGYEETIRQNIELKKKLGRRTA